MPALVTDYGTASVEISLTDWNRLPFKIQESMRAYAWNDRILYPGGIGVIRFDVAAYRVEEIEEAMKNG